MLNWLIINNEVKKPDEQTIKVEPEQSKVEPVISTSVSNSVSNSVYTEIIYLVPKNLLEDIRNFKRTCDKIDEPQRYFFYDLLDEIREGYDLKHVCVKKSVPFLTNLTYTLEVLIINQRIKTCGKDTGFSYTDKEYSDAYKKLMAIEIRNKFRTIYNIGFGICLISSIGFLLDNPFLSGVYFTNLFFYGSLVIN